MRPLTIPVPVIGAIVLALFLSPLFVVEALTPSERTLAQQAQTQLRAGISHYKAADARAAAAEAYGNEADKRAADAHVTVVTLQGQIVTLQGQVKQFADKADLIAKERDKMKPVYDEVRKYWGIGAIIYGFKSLAKHLLILAAVLVVLAIGIWILSIAAPVTAPFIMIGIRAIGGVFKLIGRGIAAVFGVLHRLLQVLVAKLTPVPKPPVVPIGT